MHWDFTSFYFEQRHFRLTILMLLIFLAEIGTPLHDALC